MRSPPQHDPTTIPLDKYRPPPRHVAYGSFGSNRPYAGHPPRLATTDSSSSSSVSPPRSPLSPQAGPMAITTSPSKMTLSTAPFRPAPMRLPSFAELNECLSLSVDDETLYHSRQWPPSLHPKMTSSPSALEREAASREPYGSKVVHPSSERVAEANDSGRLSAPMTKTPCLTATGEEVRGLTSGWLPIDDPGRSLASNAHTRRSTVSTYEQPSPCYSWSAPRQQSPSWNSSSSSNGPTPISGSSNYNNNRFRPYRRAPSQSPEQGHLSGPHQGHHPSYSHSQSIRSPPHTHQRHHQADGASGDSLEGSTKGTASSTIPRRRGKLPKDVTERLKTWLMEHAAHPYPNEDEKRRLCLQTGLSISQVSNWFINARRRILAPQQISTSAPPTTTTTAGVTSVASVAAGRDRDHDLQNAHLQAPPNSHHHQYPQSHHHRLLHEKQTIYQHQQSPHSHSHSHSHAAHYGSPETLRVGLPYAPSMGPRRAADVLSVDRSPISSHLEHSSYRRR